MIKFVHNKKEVETMLRNNLKSKKGFTLIELVVVIAILALLAGIAIPVIGYTLHRTRANTAFSNAKLAEECLKQANVQIISGIHDDYNYTTTVDKVFATSGASTVTSTVEVADVTYDLMWNRKEEKCNYVNTAKAITVTGDLINSSDWTTKINPTDNATKVVSLFR